MQNKEKWKLNLVQVNDKTVTKQSIHTFRILLTATETI